MLVVAVPLEDKGAPLQDVCEVEGGAEDPLGGSEEGGGAVEKPVEDPGSLRRQEVQLGGTEPSHNGGCERDSAGCQRGRRGERGVGMGAPGTPGAGGGAEGGGGGAGCWGGAVVPTHPTLHGIGGGGVGDRHAFLCLSLCFFPWCAHTFFGRAWAEGRRGTCNEPPRADCGQENRVKCTPP